MGLRPALERPPRADKVVRTPRSDEVFRLRLIDLVAPWRPTLLADPISDLTTWTRFLDPPHRGLSSSVNVVSNELMLIASGAIPATTDFSYNSVDGPDVVSSAIGFFFSPSADFQVVIDFAVSSENSVGLAGFSFGISEDAAGQLFVDYDSASGTVAWGVSGALGAGAPDNTGEFAGLQNDWDDEYLLVSFFLRSASVLTYPALSTGEVSVVFGDFEVLQRTPLGVGVPEPAAGLLLFAGLLLASARRPPRSSRPLAEVSSPSSRLGFEKSHSGGRNQVD